MPWQSSGNLTHHSSKEIFCHYIWKTQLTWLFSPKEATLLPPSHWMYPSSRVSPNSTQALGPWWGATPQPLTRWDSHSATVLLSVTFTSFRRQSYPTQSPKFKDFLYLNPLSIPLFSPRGIEVLVIVPECWAWLRTPLIPAFWWQRQVDLWGQPDLI